MSQTSYSIEQGSAFAGLKADSRFDEVESFAAKGAIQFGRAVAIESGNTKQVTLPKKDNAQIVFDADFVALNTIDLKVNGVAITQVTFATDHDTTAGLLATAIGALAGVTCSLNSSDANNRTFDVESDGVEISIDDIVVAAGASQAGSAVTYSADDVFRGISVHTHKEADSDGVAQYKDADAVSVLRKGVIWVDTAVAVTADETAYIDLSGAAGKFTNVSTNNMATGGKFRSSVAAAGIAKVQIDL